MNGDLRTRMILYGRTALKLGMIFMGYIRSCTNKGCFVTISKGIDIRIPFT